MGAPLMPPRFPCWCQATYSWGGETKKDLGFIEGDLIEALNAGDGSWWMGRLRRDPRAIGLFPSNFVKVLDESFQPGHASRNPSPLPAQSKASPSPAKTKSVFRRPFDAYGTIGASGSPGTRDSTSDSDREKRKEKSKFRPYSSMKTTQAPSPAPMKPLQQQEGPRIPAPPPRGHSRRPSRAPSASPTPTPGYSQPPANSMSRAASPQPSYRAPSPMPSRSPSPLPQTYHDGSAYPQLLPSSRGPSPNPYQQQDNYYGSRAPSPAPSFGYQPSYRAPSPQPYEEDLGSSPPPPPPPAHRVAYQQSRAPSAVQDYQHGEYDRGMSRTPVPPSPSGDGGSHMTPSPLRDAMNDVMSSLHDMSMYGETIDEYQEQQSHQPSMASKVWSPAEFDLVRTRSQQQHGRAQSSLGFAQYNEQETSLPPSREGLPELSNYVQRMEHQLRHTQSTISHVSTGPPALPLKGAQYAPGRSRPTTAGSSSSHGSGDCALNSLRSQPPVLKHQRSAYELGRERLNRTYTTKTNATNSTESSSATQSSTSTAMTSRSIMSGYSAGGFSATSAGSLARRKFGLGSQRGQRPKSSYEVRQAGDTNSSSRSNAASEYTGGSGPSFHESHASGNQPLTTPTADWTKDPVESAGILGGLSAPKAARKSGFFKKMIESAKTSARTGAATARTTLGSASGSRPGSRAGSPTKSLMAGMGPTVVAPGIGSRPGSAFGGGNAARDMGLGGGGEWMQVRRDINRSNSLSRREREERMERSDLLGLPAINPVDALHEIIEGDEGLDGLCISDPSDFHTTTLALVDKSTRFIQSIPPMVTAAALAQSYICRPHRSDVQRLRAIFTWVSERITWEEDYQGEVDTRRTISSKRGSSQEIAVLVREMCTAVGLFAEEIQGYLKAPGEILDLDTVQHANHWWNAVIVDSEWRVMDCSLANPTNPRRNAYTSANSQVAESWYFLARPSQICYTHIPLLTEQQHMVPPVNVEVLINLPCATPAYHKHELELADFNTSALHLENLDMTQIHITVPEDVECVAETEARAFAQDADGDCFESGDVTIKKAFAQAEWCAGRKHFTIKAVLPSDEGQATLKIYAGKRGLMHSAKDNPHALALALPLTHTGQNPSYDFHIRHPTPHAQRHDLYVVQPQCGKLTLNNTFVFCIRQHPSSLSRFTPDTWGTNTTGRPASPSNNQPFARPGSAMSMVSAFSASVSHAGSNSDYSSSSSNNNDQPGGMTAAQSKPAKLAIQTPSQKIIRLTRKMDHVSRPGGGEDDGLTTSWETVIKIGERGTWRGLVLADRSARWCVFAEWECS
ncbi:hypothetical protein LTR78_000324 [Recurvomyces mirabilis]|uniref:SH3 domain-containing protein n=1 Tax=Recurvomyces mirabilis TaxID=574656 RepID=A0AAE0WX11_9PEZI|nr:hypothetical protein LTR78_000324 [Recurvomyces mirabilis]KAK5161979.1 hypothetical protein LTS14_000325 [Recurvomyces mirabilis]